MHGGAAVLTWLKTIHIAALLIWCAGLFYLPVLFASHPRVRDDSHFWRMRIITRFTYVAVTSPAAVIAIGTGTALIFLSPAVGAWLILKLNAIVMMTFYHLYCGWAISRLYRERVVRYPGWHIAGMVVPATMIPTVFWLVLHKPI
jgi:protoporphyrinogen IX oxidase